MLLALLAAAVDRPPSLVGTWAFVDAHRDTSMAVEPCGTDYGVSYAADGTWRDLADEENGTWHRRGDTVRERVTARCNDLTGVHRRVDEPAYTIRLRWLGPDHLNIVVAGEPQGLIRCPPAPVPARP